jgi:hypothetical protein
LITAIRNKQRPPRKAVPMHSNITSAKSVMPDEFRFSHEYCVFLHDVLADIVVSGEKGRIFDVTFRGSMPNSTLPTFDARPVSFSGLTTFAPRPRFQTRFRFNRNTLTNFSFVVVAAANRFCSTARLHQASSTVRDIVADNAVA